MGIIPGMAAFFFPGSTCKKSDQGSAVRVHTCVFDVIVTVRLEDFRQFPATEQARDAFQVFGWGVSRVSHY
jgi:hypothetical protein